MTPSRRDFLKSLGLAGAGAGLASLVPLRAWAEQMAAADAVAARAATVDRDAVAAAALAVAKELGVDHADVRINRYVTQSVSTREQQVTGASREESFGFGVRVLTRGAWGFAASPRVTPEEARRVARTAVELARANAAHQKRPVKLLPAPAVRGKWTNGFARDPFDVPIDEQIALLIAINAEAMKAKGVSWVDSAMTWVKEIKFYAAADGSRIEQEIVRGAPRFTVTAVDRAKGDFQTRSSLGGPQGLGWEYMVDWPWREEARRAGEEVVEKLAARPVEPGPWDLVLEPSHLWLTIHESIGHSTELDRAMGWEANYAGTSFLTPEKAGKMRIGAPIVSFFADRTQKGALATVGWDDEGVPAQRWHLVKDGIFVDWQTTRDTAPLVGRDRSYGCLHADSWASVPFPRMPNVSLEPAARDVPLAELIAGVEKGILIRGSGSFSIDQQRYNFQFGGQTFHEIKNGKIAGMLRDVAYQSRTPDFWQACDALGGKSTYSLGGSFNDGKGEPGQSNAVSHGSPAARFRKVNVLNTAAQAK